MVTITRPKSKPSSYSGDRKSNFFRSLTLQVDVIKSVFEEPILPKYDVISHPDHPADISPRMLTYEKALREAGICLSIKPDNPQVIDDYDKPESDKWDYSELHDAMELHFAKYGRESLKNLVLAFILNQLMTSFYMSSGYRGNCLWRIFGHIKEYLMNVVNHPTFSIPPSKQHKSSYHLHLVVPP